MQYTALQCCIKSGGKQFHIDVFTQLPSCVKCQYLLVKIETISYIVITLDIVDVIYLFLYSIWLLVLGFQK